MEFKVIRVLFSFVDGRVEPSNLNWLPQLAASVMSRDFR